MQCSMEAAPYPSIHYYIAGACRPLSPPPSPSTWEAEREAAEHNAGNEDQHPSTDTMQVNNLKGGSYR
ncbi:hypothetical protein GDO81_007099 [Engystomops pustulosus]|uniref:Uncharacterized protein n=1 Tax=Engystomops pustulosus TaxID=76066 RepID=A0AAV7C5V4_ENGPU|nr:hypothetical protein GDO81_007099 [Engystomops pustulosus]